MKPEDKKMHCYKKYKKDYCNYSEANLLFAINSTFDKKIRDNCIRHLMIGREQPLFLRADLEIHFEKKEGKRKWNAKG